MDNGSGPIYLAWSGWGGDLGEVVIIGALWGAYRKHTCHVDGCWRLSRHHVEGTPYIACKKHHPTVPETVTAEHIADAHAVANQGATNEISA
jgi:hypothetical protein